MNQSYHKIDPEEATSEAREIPVFKEIPTLDSSAFYGLSGEFVRALEPHTEADPAAILLQILIAFGAACGRSPHIMIDGARHGVNEFGAIVGQSGKGRKGTSWQRTRATLRTADEEFVNTRIKAGLSSGEGLIYQVRDPSFRFDEKTQEEVMYDKGEEDKRLLIVESEFASVLKMIEREGNSLSPIMRMAWDGDKLSPLTKTSRIESTDPHISMIGQITVEELKKRLTETESANGFGNRILWFFVRRRKLLPFGGDFQSSEEFGRRFKVRLEISKTLERMEMATDFKKRWECVYQTLSDSSEGLSGMLTGRAEAHAIRLSMIFALLDGESTLREAHLIPALSIIDFVEDSVRHIFGQKIGNPVCDKLLELLKTGEKSMTEINAGLSGHTKKDQIEKAVHELMRTGKVTLRTEETGGRPKQFLSLWTAGEAGKAE